MLVNYEYYKIFYYVAKYQNFTKAAVELDNNQPNISRSVKILRTHSDVYYSVGRVAELS